MKQIRTHLSMFYDELWCDLTYNQTGKKVKPFQDRNPFSWTAYNPIGKNPLSGLTGGFKDVKPPEFLKVDNHWINNRIDDIATSGSQLLFLLKMVVAADNRMMMEDYRYGSILRQNLDNYDVVKEFFRRLGVAKETKNLEYVIDAYNMLRIQYFKQKNWYFILDLIKHHLFWVAQKAFLEKWPLVSIDDGIHAKEK